MSQDYSKLSIIHYPDPRLREKAAPVSRFDSDLAALAARMLVLMREEKGIGLAATQVGIAQRLFVMNVTDDPANDQVLINPVISDGRNPKEDEEGCLSLPDIRGQVRRPNRCRLTAQNLRGETIELEADELVARVWQHETDHLNGVLIIDRFGPSEKMAFKKTLLEMEARFKAGEKPNPPGERP